MSDTYNNETKGTVGGVTIDIAEDGLDRATKLLAGIDGGIDKAVKNAMTRATSYLRSHSAKAIRERYAISTANLHTDDNVKVRYTYQDGVQATVTYAGHKIPLFRYDGASPKQPTVNTGELVSAMVKGRWAKVHPGVSAAGHQLKGTSPTRFPNAFVAQMESGHIGIFERTGGMTSKGSDAIREIMGSSIPQMLGSTEVAEKLEQGTVEKFQERLDHEVLAILNGWGR